MGMNTILPPSAQEAKITVAEWNRMNSVVLELQSRMASVEGILVANEDVGIKNVQSKKVPNNPYYTTGQYLKDNGPPSPKQAARFEELYGKPPIGLTKGIVWLRIWEKSNS